jgi:RNA polymerase sigma factor (sigma-70 family)
VNEARDTDGSAPGSRRPRWPAHLQRLCDQIRTPGDAAARERALGETWLLLNTAILDYLHHHASRLGWACREDLEDQAAGNALDLLRRLTKGEWDVSQHHPAQVASYLSTVARHALLALQRKARRRILPQDDERDAWDLGGSILAEVASLPELPDVALERKEFAAALRRCSERLSPRMQRVWFLRVLCQMSSKEIATHPAVRLKASYVDVLLQRARRVIRECMRRQGFQSRDMPPGTFAEVVRVFHPEETVTSAET